jgi:hypothetical protein
LAILGGSFRLLAKAVLPLALLFILAACGGSTASRPSDGQVVRGNGFSFQAPEGWEVVETEGGARSAQNGNSLVSVTRLRLAKPYDPEQFDAVTWELDRIAERLARQAKAEVGDARTIEIAGRDARAYTYDGRQVAFVLVGRREYQLYCRDAGDACGLLFDSFALSGPQA